MTRAELDAMRRADIRDQEISGLAELADVWTDASRPPAGRLERLIERTGNPYCFLVDGVPVKISFNDENRTLKEALLHYLAHGDP